MNDENRAPHDAIDAAEFISRLDEVVEPAHRLAMATLLDAEEADRAVLDAALQAWSGREPDLFFRPWFLGLVVAACRQRRARTTLPGAGTAAADRSSLLRLRPLDRALLYAFFSLRLDVEEVSRTFRRSSRTVRIRIARLTRRRRAALGPSGGERPLAESLEALIPPASTDLAGRIREAIAAGQTPAVGRRRWPLAAALGGTALVALIAVTAAHLAVGADHPSRSAVTIRATTTPPLAPPSPSPTLASPSLPTPTPISPQPPSIAPVASGEFVCGDQAGSGTAGSTLATVRAGLHPGYDRFVMQFDGPVPPFEVRLQGSLVQVILQGATPSSSSPTELRTGYPVLLEAAQASDAGALEWNLRLSRPACVRVLTLGDPARLVVDVEDA